MKVIGETLAFERQGDTMILVHGSEKPRADEWTQYVLALEEAVHHGVRGIIVFTPGTGPDARQRGELNSYIPNAKTIKTVVLTSSAVARGIVTAMGWLSDNTIKSYNPTNLQQAFAFLELQGQEETEMNLHIDALREALGSSPHSKSW